MAVRTVPYTIIVSAKAYLCNLCTHSDAYERDAIRYAKCEATIYATMYATQYATLRYAKREAKRY